MENSIMGLGPPPSPPGYGKKKFSETRPFFENFFKKCIFTIENPNKLRKIFKNDKTTFRQANFCLLRCQILLQHTK